MEIFSFFADKIVSVLQAYPVLFVLLVLLVIYNIYCIIKRNMVLMNIKRTRDEARKKVVEVDSKIEKLKKVIEAKKPEGK